MNRITEAHRKLVRKLEIQDKRKRNFYYVEDNRDYLLDTFPALWVMVSNEACGQSNESLDYLMKSLRNQDLIDPANLYVFCDEYHFNVITEIGEYDV